MPLRSGSASQVLISDKNVQTSSFDGLTYRDDLGHHACAGKPRWPVTGGAELLHPVLDFATWDREAAFALRVTPRALSIAFLRFERDVAIDWREMGGTFADSNRADQTFQGLMWLMTGDEGTLGNRTSLRQRTT